MRVTFRPKLALIHKPNLMANTYTQIHIHAVFAVQNRDAVISSKWKEELYRYITGVIQARDHKLLAIGGMPDHIHILIGFRPKQSLSELMQDIKGSSSKWIKEKQLIRCRFSWQEGYSAFSYSRSDLQNVIRYIQNQREHHRKVTFMEEYVALLKEFEVEYDLRYIFKPVDSLILPSENS
jgi:putative transposase